MIELQTFIGRALRLLPALAWWALGAVLGALLCLGFEQEVFPNTPLAAAVAGWVGAAGGMLLVPLGVKWLWRVAALVEHPGWRLLWYLGATAATVLAVLAFLGGGALALVLSF